MKNVLLILSLFAGISQVAYCQTYVNNLILEKYYIADAEDASDSFSEGLIEADTTYRVFVELCEGCKLLGMFGDENHLLQIESTETFFNNELGQSFGHDIGQNFLNISTIGIDSYLSMGASSDSKLGVLKHADSDGTIWPNGTSNGLLVNPDPEIGDPLTEQDGMVNLPDSLNTTVPPGFTVQPLEQDVEAYVDAVFGTETDSTLFTSSYFESLTIRSNQGMYGSGESNQILLAQLTTSGQLSFQFNLILFVPGEGQVRVVADGENLQPGEVVSAFLKYPPQCGCTDPNFVEYNPAAPCDNGSCQELIVFGCTDSTACNYSNDANTNVQSLCCYGVDDCGELDPLLACPSLSSEFENAQNLKVYPNPVNQVLKVELGQQRSSHKGQLTLYNSEGSQVIGQDIQPNSITQNIELGRLASGIYQLVIYTDREVFKRKIIIQH